MQQVLRFAMIASLPLLAACGETDEAPEPGEPTVAETETEAEASVSEEAAIAEPVVDQSAIPAAMLGDWDYIEGTCLAYSDMKLTITPTELTFYESFGAVEDVRIDGDAVILDLAMEGEGETWEESLRLVLREGGEQLHITDPDAASDVDEYPRKRCPNGLVMD